MLSYISFQQGEISSLVDLQTVSFFLLYLLTLNTIDKLSNILFCPIPNHPSNNRKNAMVDKILTIMEMNVATSNESHGITIPKLTPPNYSSFSSFHRSILASANGLPIHLLNSSK